jgi:hypothetical protein
VGKGRTACVMCKLFATKDLSHCWRSSIDDVSVVDPKDTSAPLWTMSVSAIVLHFVMMAYAEKNRPFPVKTVMKTSSCSATSSSARASL